VELVSKNSGVIVKFSTEELMVLAGSVNEAIEIVDDWEFLIRLGVDKDVAREVRSGLRRIMHASPSPEP
jgi:hypothetical protein